MFTPFIKTVKSKKPNYDILNILGRNPTTGDIGLEVEVEGNKFPKDTPTGQTYIPAEWKYCKDGSLRGKDNAEYVFRKPLLFSEVPNAVKRLWDMFGKYGSILDDSNRTSVHVHLNAQKFYLNRLAAFLAIYYSVEEILTKWCGSHREGNLFCLRSKDAPAVVSKLKKFIKNDGQQEYLDQGLHYAGLNAHALMKFGSIEIRTLRGVTSPEPILTWVSILERIYKMSAEYPDPRVFVDEFSGNGPIAFFDKVLGTNANIIRHETELTDTQIMESMYDGIRLAQDIAYCREWSEYNPVAVEFDPFDRKVRTTLAPFEAALQNLQAQSAQSFSTQWGSINQIVQPSNSGYISLYPLAPAEPTTSEEPDEDDMEEYFEPEYEEEDNDF